jgi:hypothetical protein
MITRTDLQETRQLLEAAGINADADLAKRIARVPTSRGKLAVVKLLRTRGLRWLQETLQTPAKVNTDDLLTQPLS